MKPFAVIGLGKFGRFLAFDLYEMGHEVVALDVDPERVQAIKNNVSEAIVGDATDIEVLKAAGLDELDDVVVCIGTQMGASILTTLGLKELGVKRIFAKAISEPHQRILEKVGATEVFFPERNRARSLAERLHSPNVLDYLPLMEGHSIIETAAPEAFLGRSLRDLDLANRHGVQVVAIKELVPERVHVIPTGQFVVKDSDVLVLIGPTEELEKLQSDD